MEAQNILDMKVGTKESTVVKPAIVKIVKVGIEVVGAKSSEKVVCEVKHPDKEEPIKISSVKYETKGTLKVSGLWLNLDEDKKIRKGSALAVLMATLGCETPRDLVGREINTVEDETGYLVFKAY